MKLWLKISQGLAALLLSAAALSLLLFAGALILGLAAAVLIAAAGLFLAAPDEAKTGLKNVADRFAESVNDMGEVVLACFGARQAAPDTPHESGSGENMSPTDNTNDSARTATDDPSGQRAAQ